jgi:hypothetical protein
MTRTQFSMAERSRAGTKPGIAYDARVGTMDVLLGLTPAAIVLAAATVLLLVLI